MVGPYTRHAAIALLALLTSAVLGGCAGGSRATMSDLRSVDELKARFNRDAGKPRVVLLLSPT